MLTGDPDLDRALSRAESLHGEILPEDRATGAEYAVWLDGILVGRSWRSDASTASYLLRHPCPGRPN